MIRYILHTLQRAVALAVIALCSLTALAVDYYVTPRGITLTAGAGVNAVWTTAWSDATSSGVLSFSAALEKAAPGDNIFLLGFENPNKIDSVYIPADVIDNNYLGYSVKSGVKIYGGWASHQKPSTATLSNRITNEGSAYFKYRSVVSADGGFDDEPNKTTGLSHQTPSRKNNARHVFAVDLNRSASGNTSSASTVIDGVVIAGGVAGKATGDIEARSGGGIYIYSSAADCSPFVVSNCVLFNNYALNAGGAVYVAESASADGSIIYNCIAFNNEAGDIGKEVSSGGGMYIAGKCILFNSVIHNNINGGLVLGANAQAINVTVAMNSTAGIDALSESSIPSVYNSVIWNNDRLYFSHRPDFHYSAFHEIDLAGDANSNIYVSRLSAYDHLPSAFFLYPSNTHGFDYAYKWNVGTVSYANHFEYHISRWSIIDKSVFINKGNNGYLDNIKNTAYSQTDLAGNARTKDGTVDIGAYESVPVNTVIRVKPDGNDANDGSTWTLAKKTVQAAVDAAAAAIKDKKGSAEVWVAAGYYTPQGYLVVESDDNSRVRSFRMRHRVNVYGGFAGTEKDKRHRLKVKMADGDSLYWRYKNETVLIGAGYLADGTTDKPGVTPDIESGKSEFNETTKFFEGSTSTSTHVVWFAPIIGETQFTEETLLEGVTVMGGKASGDVSDYYRECCGAGIFAGRNARIVNCIVTECEADSLGGGVYLDGGIIEGSLICNNSAKVKGGGVYMNLQGLVTRTMLTNNISTDGAALYMKKGATTAPYTLILSTSVISNNLAHKNGAVYADNGGVILQSTITNNESVGSAEASTGGLYIDSYAKLYNNILWNNIVIDRPVQLYIDNPSRNNTLFYNTALSNMGRTVWNDTWQQNLISLAEDNSTTNNADIDDDLIQPNFSLSSSGVYTSDNDLKTKRGLITNLKYRAIDYLWKPKMGSGLRNKGMSYYLFHPDVIYSPELDITGNPFDQLPAVGANRVLPKDIQPGTTDGKYIIYVNPDCKDITHDGSSWEKAYVSLSDAISYLTALSNAGSVPTGIDTLEVHVMEGTFEPCCSFMGDDVLSSSLLVEKSNHPIKIVGGYSSAAATGNVLRNPQTYRTVIDANTSLEEGSAYYHCVRVGEGARVVFDGLWIVNGDARNSIIKRGAGMIVDSLAEVKLYNMVFENNTAQTMAAIDAEKASVEMYNCVINNNTCTSNTGSPAVMAKKLRLEHCTFVNNFSSDFDCSAKVDEAVSVNSYSLNNRFKHDESELHGHITLSDVSTDELHDIFVNPTTAGGATLGHQTYLGGYPSFQPLTSSAFAGEHIINKGASTSVDTDINLNPRNLGGVPDLGAYEAELPEAGRVYYVRTTGDDNHDGLSWATAFKTIRKALDVAEQGTVIDNAKPSVWVAAGTYEQDPIATTDLLIKTDNCFVIRDGVNVFGGFPATGNPGMNDRHPLISSNIYSDEGYKPADYETILQPKTKTQGIGRVLGQHDRFNPTPDNHFPEATVITTYRYVGDGKGDYKLVDTEGWYLVQQGLYGDEEYFPNPGYYKRFDNLEQTAYSGWGCSTIGLVNRTGDGKLSFINVGTGVGSYRIDNATVDCRWNNDTYFKYTKGGPSSEHIYAEFKKEGYYQVNPDGMTGYFYISEAGYYRYFTAGEYIYVGDGKGDYNQIKTTVGKEFVYPTTWDGFTIRNGSLDSDKIRYLSDYEDKYSTPESTHRRNGGAGVVLFKNVTIKNSVITDNLNYYSVSWGYMRGGAVYCDGGSLVGCYIMNNAMGREDELSRNIDAYGGGCYMYSGTAYNCVISKNKTYAQHAEGAGIFIESAQFYNNTIVHNVSNGSTSSCGGICIWSGGSSKQLTVYNCISVANTGSTGRQSTDLSSTGGSVTSYNSIFGKLVTGDNNILNYDCKEGNADALFVDATKSNYRLKAKSPALNMGVNIPVVDGNTINLFDYTDMDFSDRIKDCTVDAGAYELDNKQNITPDNSTASAPVFYVTESGSGSANGSSPDNAACEMKLQDVLYAAGKLVADDKTPIVKIAAGDYEATQLADEFDPQSYTFTVPYGVTVKGGYTDLFDNFDTPKGEAARNAFSNATILIPLQIKNGVEVRGHHVLTFADKSADAPEGKTTIVDGLFLDGGHAVSTVGKDNMNGGGAVVPGWVHIRNCVVQNCKAADNGGGLYLKAGALVSGSLIRQNTASHGGGIYAENENVTDRLRSHVLSTTVFNNTASEGGGIMFEDGAVMGTNCVFFGNNAMADKQVSGNVDEQYPDELWKEIMSDTETADLKLYPFNHTGVEMWELPSNFSNMKMDKEQSVYFLNNDDCQIRSYSPLIRQGCEVNLQEKMVTLGVSAYDMAGKPRISGSNPSRIDMGYRAFEGGQMVVPDKEEDVVPILFVKSSPVVDLEGELTDEQLSSYTGRSFVTPLITLDRALNYIKHVRSKGLAVDTQFTILLCGETFKPSIRREDAMLQGHNQRLNSFVIPQGVRIYGGFSGNEKIEGNHISCMLDEITHDGAAISLNKIDETNLPALLDARERYDDNGNGIIEPYEFKNRSVLSGDVNTDDATEDNVYHVLFSRDMKGSTLDVVLDGVTVSDGRTYGQLGEKEMGKGAALYTYGVDYVMRMCRIINNFGFQGNAVYADSASVRVYGSIFAGNGSISEGIAGGSAGGSGGGSTSVDVVDGASNSFDVTNGRSNTNLSGGAFYGRAGESTMSFSAVNTLFVHNDAVNGAVIATDGSKYEVNLMNCDLIYNKAFGQYVVDAQSGTIANTVIWGNECTGDVCRSGLTVSHSASDVLSGVFASGQNNIHLSNRNMNVDGPRYSAVSDVKGSAGYNIHLTWNPAAISVLTDNGDGSMPRKGVAGQELGAYKEFLGKWFPGYDVSYYMRGLAGDTLHRYIGKPLVDEEKPADYPCRIDIGMYEYGYPQDMAGLDSVYVDVVEHGNGSGDSWSNATSSLDAALRALSNPKGGKHKTKKVFIRGGEYSLLPSNDEGMALYINCRRYYLGEDMIDSLWVRGAYDDNGNQDFSSPTVIRINPIKKDDTKQLMKVFTKGVDVIMEGLAFDGEITDGTTTESKKVTGLQVSTSEGGGKEAREGDLVLKNVLFSNLDTAMFYATATDNKGRVLLANVLAADNNIGVAIGDTVPESNIKIVNATFARNQKADIPALSDNVFNSVSWKNGTDNLKATDANRNKVLSAYDNDNVLQGPNFVDPANGDYRIRPNMQLLNQGSDKLYTTALGLTAAQAKDELCPTGEARFVGTIDVGAYEYANALNDTLYVRLGAVGDGSGRDWDNAISDLQTAVDHAGVYVMNAGKNDARAYVMVNPNIKYGGLRVSLPHVSIYGTMVNGSNTVNSVDKRGGILEAESRSAISGLTIAASDVVIDGFEINSSDTEDNITIKGDGSAFISTSVINDPIVLRQNDTLYNSLALKDVTGGYVVNVTAVGNIAGNSRVVNSVSDADSVGYITEPLWVYQLKETDGNYIDNGISSGDNFELDRFTARAGHSNDITGSPRVRNTVDCGAFETWNFLASAVNNTIDASVAPTADHVVYVREGAELALADDTYTSENNPFAPGYLLLEHGAELLGRGNYVRLTNFDVERKLVSGTPSFVSMPFVVENIVIGSDTFDFWTSSSYQDKLDVYYYDGDMRAAYDFVIDTKDAWLPINNPRYDSKYAGLLLEPKSNMTMRVVGTFYEENPTQEKYIPVYRYNHNDSWTSTSDGGNRFTHKENMSWNLVGSPYLSTMNYGDMDYGRMIYKLNGKGYTSVNTASDRVTGTIPVGDAVFTQTATLRDVEQVPVRPRTGVEETEYNAVGYLVVAIDRTDAAAAYAPGVGNTADAIALTAVASEDARTDYDIARDAVKMAALDTLATEIYIIRYGRHYSLLSDLDIEGTVPVGVSVGTAGNYSIHIPDYADHSAYETVVLHDTYTDKAVDLKDTEYLFAASESGSIDDRFYITFQREDSELDEVQPVVYTPYRGTAVITGLDVMKQTTIHVYDSKGMLVTSRTVHDISTTFTLPPDAAYLFLITTPDTKDKVVLKAIL